MSCEPVVREESIVNGTTVRILADRNNSDEVALGAAGTTLKAEFTEARYKAQPRTAGGPQIVTEYAAPTLTLVIQTHYAPGVDPSVESGYGRGTTEQDGANHTTSLRFHEECHVAHFGAYVAANPPPVFVVPPNATVAQFQETVRTWTAETTAYRARMEADGVAQVDCVGSPMASCPAAGAPAEPPASEPPAPSVSDGHPDAK